MPGMDCTVLSPTPETAAGVLRTPPPLAQSRPAGPSAVRWPRYDFESRLAEVLFALSTMLVFTLAVERLVSPDTAGVSALLLSAAGYSFLWALFVGAMFVVQAMDQRGRVARFADTYHLRPNEEQALDAISHEMDSTLASLVNEQMRERLHWQILSNIALLEPRPVHVQFRDILGALGTTSVVFIATIPAIVPFLCCSTPWAAVRASNIITILLLFVCGYYWARFTHTRPVLTGLLLAGFGATAVWISLNIP